MAVIFLLAMFPERDLAGEQFAASSLPLGLKTGRSSTTLLGFSRVPRSLPVAVSRD